MATFEERLNEALTDQQIDAIRVAAGLDKETQLKISDLVRAVAVLIRQGEIATRTKMEALLREVNRVIDQGFGGIAAEQITAIKEFGELAATGFIQAVNELAGISLLKKPQRISAGAEKQIIMGAPQADWWEGQSARMQANFSREVRQGFIAGDTTEQLVQRLVGTRARGDEPAVPGVIEITRRDARALVHTSVQSVANEARREVFKANSDIIIGTRQTSTLDSRVTIICAARDRKEWDTQGRPIGHSIPYRGGVGNLHWGCRSVETPILRPLVINGVEIGGFRGSQRASMDGPVDNKLSFQDWMGKKPAAFLDEVLGEGRAQLYRDKKLTLNDLLDQRGNELTLAQLKAKYQ